MVDATLTYRGDGDYDCRVGGVKIELSYDGSDHAVGEWTVWEIKLDGQLVGGSQLLGEGPFTDWLEEQARRDGHLPDEP